MEEEGEGVRKKSGKAEAEREAGGSFQDQAREHSAPVGGPLLPTANTGRSESM